MSDRDETSFFQGSCTCLGKRKRKKHSTKEAIPRKTEGSWEKKKKKSSKCKDTMAERKEKTKDNKKKNRLYLEQNDSLILTQASNSQANRKPKTWNPHNHMSQDCKTKRKKKVTFDLPPAYIRIKRPQFASSFLPCPKESIVFKKDTVGDIVSLTQDNNSPSNSEELNSQDLFITQKTFRVSSPDPSGEAHIITATPQVLPHGGMQYVPVVLVKQQRERSTRDSNTHQHQSKTQTTEFLIKKNEEDVGVHEAQHNHTNGNMCFQKPVELNVNPFEEKKLSRVHVKPILNPLLTESNAVTPMLDVAKSNKPSCFSSQQMSTSTQTENFFTTERSSYLIFCHKVNLRLEELRPLDLSLPQRARKDLRTALPGQVKTSGCRDPILYPDIKQIKKDTKKDDDLRGKTETTPSLQSMPDSKSADTIVSSGDSGSPYCFNKLDLTQVRAVQTRLNESFFFKTKGDIQLPRPESPLMKLAQKNRK